MKYILILLALFVAFGCDYQEIEEPKAEPFVQKYYQPDLVRDDEELYNNLHDLQLTVSQLPLQPITRITKETYIAWWLMANVKAGEHNIFINYCEHPETCGTNDNASLIFIGQYSLDPEQYGEDKSCFHFVIHLTDTSKIPLKIGDGNHFPLTKRFHIFTRTPYKSCGGRSRNFQVRFW